MPNYALIIIDVQNDFCPGGAVPVPEGDAVVPVLNNYIHLCHEAGAAIFASRDWHPETTRHFKDYGGPWPRHCVQNTDGAEFHAGLHLTHETAVLSKGMDQEKDDYSAFDGVDVMGRPLRELIYRAGATRLLVGGLATDYCVKNTVHDALRLGFRVWILTDAIRGVQPEESQKALAEMVRQGARKANFEAIRRELHGVRV